MPHVDGMHSLQQQHQACSTHLQLLLPALITQPDPVAVTLGGSLSPVNTVLCMRELHERMHKLRLDGVNDFPCRVDWAIAAFNMVCKMNLTGSSGIGNHEAWHIAMQQKSHIWALHAHLAHDAGPLQHLGVLDVQMRADWLSRIEASLLETMGGGLWDVQRPEAVGGVLQCVWEHMDIAACADDSGMVTPKKAKMYFDSSAGAVLEAAYEFLCQRIGGNGHLVLLAQTWLKTLDILARSYFKGVSEPVHMHDLSTLHAQVEALVHAVVLLCEYVLLCEQASAKLAGGG